MINCMTEAELEQYRHSGLKGITEEIEAPLQKHLSKWKTDTHLTHHRDFPHHTHRLISVHLSTYHMKLPQLSRKCDCLYGSCYGMTLKYNVSV